MDVNEKSASADVSDKSSFKKTIQDAVPKIEFSHSKEIISAVVVGVFVTVISTAILNGYFNWEGVQTNNSQNIDYAINPETVQTTNRAYIMRSRLSQVMAVMSSAKVYLAEYYMLEGRFPTDSDKFSISALDLNEYEQIDDSYLTNEGGIGVHLSSDFGEGKRLTLQPSASKNGAFIKWRCETNIDEKYLGFGKSRPCDYRSDLSQEITFGLK